MFGQLGDVTVRTLHLNKQRRRVRTREAVGGTSERGDIQATCSNKCIGML